MVGLYALDPAVTELEGAQRLPVPEINALPWQWGRGGLHQILGPPVPVLASGHEQVSGGNTRRLPPPAQPVLSMLRTRVSHRSWRVVLKPHDVHFASRRARGQG